MTKSIFTEFNPTLVGRRTWFKIRPLTMEDVTFSEWKFSEAATINTKIYAAYPIVSCAMTVKPGVFDLLPDMDKGIVETFLRIFADEHRYPSLEVAVSYVGIRKSDQWLKFNDALTELRQKHDLQKDALRQQCLDDMNNSMGRYVDEVNRIYISEAICFYSKIDSYDRDILDQSAGNSEINDQIKALKDKRDTNRQQALKDCWEKETPVDHIPKEVTEAIKKHVLEKGFTKPDGFFGWD